VLVVDDARGLIVGREPIGPMTLDPSAPRTEAAADS
jgi:hypothetical protein